MDRMSVQDDMMESYNAVMTYFQSAYQQAMEAVHWISNCDLFDIWQLYVNPLVARVGELAEAQLVAPLILMLIGVLLIHQAGRREKEADSSAQATLNSRDDTALIASAINLAKTAYEEGHASKLISLLEAHHNISINTLYGKTGLSIFLSCCLSGEKYIVSYLLHKGGDVHVKSRSGDSALYLATYGVLSSARPDISLLHQLVDAGCDVNVQNKRGYTPLHRAANKGDISVIKALLKLGADPYITNISGIYPLDSAINAGHIEAAHLLKIELDNPYVWDVVDPHTPPSVRLGLMSPLKKHLMESTIPTCRRSKREVFQAEL